MVLLSIIFLHESDPRRDHQQIVLYSFLSLHALALHLAVKILLQIFLYEDLSTLSLTYICRLYFLRMPAGPRTLLRNTIKLKTFLIFDINHQQNTRRGQTRLKR